MNSKILLLLLGATVALRLHSHDNDEDQALAAIEQAINAETQDEAAGEVATESMADAHGSDSPVVSEQIQASTNEYEEK